MIFLNHVPSSPIGQELAGCLAPLLLMGDPPAVRHDHQQLGRDDGEEGVADNYDSGDGDDDDDGGITCETARLLAPGSYFV